MRIKFKNNLPNIPVYKYIFEKAIIPFLNKHNYRINDCDISYEMVDIDTYNVRIRPITDICEINLDVKIN